jgi:hypothetical protein
VRVRLHDDVVRARRDVERRLSVRVGHGACAADDDLDAGDGLVAGPDRHDDLSGLQDDEREKRKQSGER